jgi:hypothetical protein
VAVLRVAYWQPGDVLDPTPQIRDATTAMVPRENAALSQRLPWRL